MKFIGIKCKINAIKNYIILIFNKIKKIKGKYDANKFFKSYNDAVKERGGIELATLDDRKMTMLIVEKNKQIKKEKNKRNIWAIISFFAGKIFDILYNMFI